MPGETKNSENKTAENEAFKGKTATFLLELISEEIPPAMQIHGEEALRSISLWGNAVHNKGILIHKIVHECQATSFSTPRRLAMMVKDVAICQADKVVERKGPRVGSGQQALDGFCRSMGLQSIDACEQRELPNGIFYFVTKTIKGRLTAEILAEKAIDSYLRLFPWPSQMRWGRSNMSWIRPLRHITAIFDDQPLEGSVALGAGMELPFRGYSLSHRREGNQQIPIPRADDYEEILRKAGVIVAREKRRDKVQKCTQLNGKDPLLDEITGLVECPSVFTGDIDDQFMDLPAVVLEKVMRDHQRYVPVYRIDGERDNTLPAKQVLEPHFIGIVDGKGEVSDQIKRGHQRVLKARLADANFFFAEDRKTRLDEWAAKLDQVTLHAKLGTMADKTERLKQLAVWLCDKDERFADLKEMLVQAASLAKADLATGLVKELPSLQGTIGAIYARYQTHQLKISSLIIDAIGQHYSLASSPQDPNLEFHDKKPATRLAWGLSLIDKMDSLCGFWAVGLRITGAGDPYGMRRLVDDIIRLVILIKNIDYSGLGRQALDIYRKSHFSLDIDEFCWLGLHSEIADRWQVKEVTNGSKSDWVTAIRQRPGRGIEDLDDHLCAWEFFFTNSEHSMTAQVMITGQDDKLRPIGSERDMAAAGPPFLTIWRRIHNMLRGADALPLLVPGNPFIDGPSNCLAAFDPKDLIVDEDRLEEKVEEDLWFEVKKTHFKAADKSLDAVDRLCDVYAMRVKINAFFDNVMVLSDDAAKKRNRLAILRNIYQFTDSIADFSLITIPGDKDKSKKDS